MVVHEVLPRATSGDVASSGRVRHLANAEKPHGFQGFSSCQPDCAMSQDIRTR